MFCRLKSKSKSCVSFWDCSNLPKKVSVNCLMESKVKFTSLGVEADEVVVVASLGGGGANVGMKNFSFSNTPCRVFPKHASSLFLASSCSFWSAASNCLRLSSGMSSYLCRQEWNPPWRGQPSHRPLRPMNSDISLAESPKSMLTQNWPTLKR